MDVWDSQGMGGREQSAGAVWGLGHELVEENGTEEVPIGTDTDSLCHTGIYGLRLCFLLGITAKCECNAPRETLRTLDRTLKTCVAEW